MEFVSNINSRTFEAKFGLNGDKKTYKIVFDRNLDDCGNKEFVIKMEKESFRVSIPEDRIDNLIWDVYRVIGHFEKTYDYPTEDALYSAFEDIVITLVVLYNGTFDAIWR